MSTIKKNRQKVISRSKGKTLLFNPYKDTPERRGDLATDLYGFVPKSVWNVKVSKQLKTLVEDKFAGREGLGKKGNGKNGLSLLPPDVAMQIIKFYTMEGDNVLDPYSNRGVGSMIAYLIGRNGYCHDIVPEYVEDMKVRFAQMKNDIKSDKVLEVVCADARKSPYADGMFQLIYSSPPFWDVEKYESVDGQMSDIEDYDEFLDEYTVVLKECYRLLEEGGFIIYQVNDFRKDGKFYDFHGDTIHAMKEAGFEQHDIIINELSSASMAAIGSFERSGVKYMPKCHEYLIVFKKPYSNGKYKGLHRFEKLAVEEGRKKLKKKSKG